MENKYLKYKSKYIEKINGGNILNIFPISITTNSKIGGRGVIATRDINENEIVEIAPIIIDKYDNFKNILKNYIFKNNDDDACLVFGYGSMYNHSDNYNLNYEKKDDFFYYTANQKIFNGSELFINYGSEWFSSRNIEIKK